MNPVTVLKKLNLTILIGLWVFGIGGCATLTIFVAHDQIVSRSDNYKILDEKHKVVQAVDEIKFDEFHPDIKGLFKPWEVQMIRECQIQNDCFRIRYEIDPDQLLWGGKRFANSPWTMAGWAWLCFVPLLIYSLLARWVVWLFRPES